MKFSTEIQEIHKWTAKYLNLHKTTNETCVWNMSMILIDWVTQYLEKFYLYYSFNKAIKFCKTECQWQNNPTVLLKERVNNILFWQQKTTMTLFLCLAHWDFTTLISCIKCWKFYCIATFHVLSMKCKHSVMLIIAQNFIWYTLQEKQ